MSEGGEAAAPSSVHVVLQTHHNHVIVGKQSRYYLLIECSKAPVKAQNDL